MKCHICLNELTPNPKLDYSRGFQLDCRSHFCQLRKLVERCRLSYSPGVSKLYFSQYTLWVPQEKFWWKLSSTFDRSISAERTRVIQDSPNHIDGSILKPIINYEGSFNISIDDNLPDKVQKLIRKIQTIVTFG